MILSLGACSLIPNQPDGGDDNKPSDGSVTVTFLSDKGAFENGEASVEVKADANGKIVINSVPRHDGYAFVGWFDGSAEFDPSAKYTKSQTFTAKYASGADEGKQIAHLPIGGQRNDRYRRRQRHVVLLL